MRSAWRLASTVLIGCGIAACGDNGSSNPPDAAGSPDASTIVDGGGPDGFAGCAALEDYGDLGAVDGTAISEMASTSTTPDYMEFRGVITGAGPTPHELVIELYKLDGTPFAADIATGTYMLSGVNAQYMTCYVCLLVEVDVAGGDQHRYLATGGTVDITSVETNLTATISDVTLQHVNIDPQTYVSTPASTCTSSITTGSLDEEIVPQP